MVKLLLVKVNVLTGLCFMLELLLLDELEDVLPGLPPHEVGHVSAFLFGSFEVHQKLVCCV